MATEELRAKAAADPSEVLAGIRNGKSANGLCLRGARLAGEDLSGLDFSGADLTEADLSGAVLRGTKLCAANLYRARLAGADFLMADLSNAELRDCQAEGAGFGAADLSGARMAGARLREASLSRSTLIGADLCVVDLSAARLQEADLSGANLAGADLRGADLSGARVARASFRDCDLRDACFSGLRGFASADWIGVDLREADFRHAHEIRRLILDENFLWEFRTQGWTSELLYRLWRLTSDCGRSLGRWGIWTLTLITVFALLFRTVDIDYGHHVPGLLSSFYFSVVTLTTLGYGDILPASPAAQALVILEVTFGYLTLGGLISILANKMARRAD